MYVDIEEGGVDVEEVIATFQELPHRLTDTRYLIIRWPDVAGLNSDEEAYDVRCQEWADTIAERASAVGYGQLHTGVVRFRVGLIPRLIWASTHDGALPRQSTDEALLGRALRVEVLTLMSAGRAIWRPTDYHYQLPSGEHVGAFIRVGDAFRSPRDVRVVSSWLAARLRDDMALVADSATLVPLITDLQALMREQGWTCGRVEMLDEYPRTRLDITRAVRPLASSAGGVLGLLSVSSSGRYRGLMHSVLASTAASQKNWSMVVMVDKTASNPDRELLSEPAGVDDERVSTWTAVADAGLDPLDADSCTWCRDNKRASLVRIDPRNFEALALPGVSLMTPDTVSARASLDLWQRCHATGAIGVEVEPFQGPSRVARPKSVLMGVRIHFNRLLSQPEELSQAVAERISAIRQRGGKPGGAGDRMLDFSGCDVVVVPTDDANIRGFEHLYETLKEATGFNGADRVEMSPGDGAPDAVASAHNALLLSLGNVTGWTMRQLLLAVRDSWRGRPGRELAGLVVHTRPSTKREWQNLSRSFGDRLHALWETYLPWRSPLAEEAVHLRQFATSATEESLSPAAQQFLTERRWICDPRVLDWTERLDDARSAVDGNGPEDEPADPRSVLWGSPPRGGNPKVRNQSLYGYEVDALTAYAAVGSAMHSKRLDVAAFDPRQRMFEIPAITRSYYDGIILACILRWAQPQECWWGESEREASNVMTELLARTQDDGDRKILLPELLLAASQGKVPHKAQVELIEEAQMISSRWDELDRAPVQLGLALARAASITPLP